MKKNKEREEILQQLELLIPNRYENFIQSEKLAADKNFIDGKFDKITGGFVALHKNYPKQILIQNLRIAQQLSDDGFGVVMSSEIETSFYLKGIWKFKTLFGFINLKNAIQQNLRKAKSKNVVLFIKDKPNASLINRGLVAAIFHDEKKLIKNVIIKLPGKKSILLSCAEITSGRAGQLLNKYIK